MYEHAQAHTRARADAHMYMHMHIAMHMHTHTCTGDHTRANACAWTRTRASTHMPPDCLSSHSSAGRASPSGSSTVSSAASSERMSSCGVRAWGSAHVGAHRALAEGEGHKSGAGAHVQGRGGRARGSNPTHLPTPRPQGHRGVREERSCSSSPAAACHAGGHEQGGSPQWKIRARGGKCADHATGGDGGSAARRRGGGRRAGCAGRAGRKLLRRRRKSACRQRARPVRACHATLGGGSAVLIHIMQA